MSGIHEITYNVRPCEAGYGKTALPGALLNYLQDAAFDHSIRLGSSVFDLFPLGLTWVLSRYHVRILRYPLSKERIRIQTWYSGSQRPFHLREWRILDPQGEELLLATSSWLIVDLKTGRPSDRDVTLKDYLPTEKRAMEDNFKPLPVPRRQDITRRFPVRVSDTDLNRHVNHVQHILWSLESVPEGYLSDRVPVGIEVSYKGEILFGQETTAATEVREDGTCLHRLIIEPGGKEAARLRTVWKKGEGKAGDRP